MQHFNHQKLHPWELPAPSEPGTSLMLRNFPNNYTRSMLIDLLVELGFGGTYDFVYLPMDFKSQANLGYSFVNFLDRGLVESFWRTFEGFTAWNTRSSSSSLGGSGKVGHAEWNVCQGLDALIERFRNNPVMHENCPQDFKPLLFVDGVETKFPEPTKPIKAPRIRKPVQKLPKGRPTTPPS